MSADSDSILANLDRHARIFDLSDGLGSDLLDVAVEGARGAFDAQCDENGNRWPDLSEGYGNWKARHFPGLPMGALDDVLGQEIDGERTIQSDSASVACGSSEEGIDHSEWFQDGDPEANRPPRKFFAIGPVIATNSDRVLDKRFDERTR